MSRAFRSFIAVLVAFAAPGTAQARTGKLPDIDSSWAKLKLNYDDKAFLEAERFINAAWRDKIMRGMLLQELEKQAKALPKSELAVFKWAYVATLNDKVSLALEAKKALASVPSPINIRTARLLLLVDYWLYQRRVGQLRGNAVSDIGKLIVNKYPTDWYVIRLVADILSWSKELEDREESVRMVRVLIKLKPKNLEYYFSLGLYQTFVYEKSVRKSDLVLARDNFVQFITLIDSSKYIYLSERETRSLTRAAKSWIETLDQALRLKKSFNPER